MKASQVNMWLSTLTNIGVLIGIGLLVVELNQNAELTRVEIHAMRAEAKADRQMNLANSGEIVRIFGQARQAGFPEDPTSLDTLTAEDRFRMAVFVGGLREAIGNWHYQCRQGMLDEELCKSGYRAQVRNLIQTLHGLNIGLRDMPRSFIEDVRRIAKEDGLPVPNEDGSW